MARVLVVGELNVDLVMSGLPSLPILGQELVGDGFQMVMGSSSAITAARLAQLGADVDFVGIVGDDYLGGFVLEELRNFGVGITHIAQVSEPTGVTIALTYNRDRALLTYPGTIETFTGDAITPDLLDGYVHIHVGSFFLQRALQPNLARIFQMAHKQGLTTSLDVGWDPQEDWSDNPHLFSTLAYVDYFIPNQDEVAALLDDHLQPKDLIKQLDGLLIMKCGKNGATSYDSQGEVATVESMQVDVVDTTGAGDAFNAGFIFAYKVEQLLIEDAMRFAAVCGAQAVTQIGGAANAPHADKIRTLIDKANTSEG